MTRDVGVTRAVQEWLPEWTLTAFSGVSLLGDLLVIVPALGLLYLADVGRTLRRGDTDHPLCSDRTAFLVATVFGGLALIVFLEAVFGLGRPPAEWHVIDPSEYGFPSGHTMAATVFWGALAWWAPIGRRPRRVVAAGVVVGLVGLSRLALGVHYLVDVVAAVAFGVVYLALIGRIGRARPGRAFGVALGIALAAVVVTGGGGRASLALAGTVGAAVGWWVIERPAVRDRVFETVGRLRQRS